MSKLRFASRTLTIAVVLIAIHFLMLAIKPCIKGHIPCEASIKPAGKKQSNGDDDAENKFPWGKGFPPLSTSYISDALKPRHSFKTYEEYIQLQLKKTMNPHLRKLWTSKDWRRKVDVFSLVFQNLMKTHLLKTSDKALCIAARVGQEVLALKELGVNDSIGVDLIASPPLVIEGDMHRLPFAASTFDFEFSNAFDHALFPAMFASEIERTLKTGGIVVLHVALRRRPDKFSANDLLSVDSLLQLFTNFDVVHVRDVDAFGLDSEVVLKKRQSRRINNVKQGDGGVEGMVKKCSSTKVKQEIIDSAEPLIMEEPIKPWITLKQNAKNIKYLPTLINMHNYSRYVYIDVGARGYSSSIGSWFTKRYPTQNHDFSIYAVEADRAFAKQYVKHKEVHFLPYAAWVRNESLMFGASPENRAAEGDIGMGRIQRQLSNVDTDKDVSTGSQRHRNTNSRPQSTIMMGQRQDTDDKDVPVDSQRHRSANSLLAEGLQKVHGFDFAEWLAKAVTKDDFVVMKMDIEGTEFDLLPRMLETGAMCLVDELFLECHYNRWQRTSPKRTSKYKSTYDECLSLFQALRRNGVLVHQWW
eukprot:c12113_g1_i1 orf=386-2140(+)